MNTTTIRRLTIATAAVAGLAFFAQSAGVASAETSVREGAARLQSANNLKQMSIAAHNYDADGDVDGRDFLVWQRGGSPAATDTAEHELGHVLGLRHEFERPADGDTDGNDFLAWQRQLGSQTSIAAGDLAHWQSNYGTGY